MTALNLSLRARFVNDDGTLAPEAYRLLNEVINRTGGVLGSVGGDAFASPGDMTSQDAQASGVSDTTAQPAAPLPLLLDMTAQPATPDALGEMVMQPASELRFLDLPQYATANAPAYAKGRLYYDTTLNAARIGGASAYETITSA
ncbi:MAG: hypothetical protein JWR74_3190 [Polaromonas sp.]|nr:hypothetical protein [Polaromonas sp.]